MSSTISPELLARALAFRDDDPDPATRAELSALIDAADAEQLAERFAGRLDFGTAGLRGLLGAGESRMNRRVVAQTTAGLCAYLIQSVPNAQRRGLCLGWDGRHQSRELAEEVIAIASGQGFVVHAFDDVVPTPVLAFSVQDRGAAAGVMITASHNPPAYNGYKVYWENGAQIIPPHELGIAAAIHAVPRVLALPRPSCTEARARGLLVPLHGLCDRYFAGVRALVGAPAVRAGQSDHGVEGGSPAELCIAYTALHGVGERFARRALGDAGFSKVHSVAAQAEPDGAFPTLAFPNPEEPGAMDLVLELGTRCHAQLAIANDPDADRLALATRNSEGHLVTLSGNDIGVLLGDYLLARAPRDGRNLVLSSIVSTPLLARIAQAYDARWEPTLTGFKWIANRALELCARDRLRFVFGFEEALGYTAGSLVHDKDGIACAALAARMASDHATAGRSLLDALEIIHRQHGLYGSRQQSIVLPGHSGMSRMQTLMQRLRSTPPSQVGDHAVLSVLDLESGTLTRAGVTAQASLPRSDVLVFELAGEHRIAIRPSGTEPKLKIYLDVRVELPANQSVASARARANDLLTELGEAFQRLL